LDLETKMGPGRPKNQSSHIGLKKKLCVGLIDTNPTQLEWAQTDVVCSIYHDLFVFPNRQKVNVEVSLMWQHLEVTCGR
jgi:hypothetical protein